MKLSLTEAGTAEQLCCDPVFPEPDRAGGFLGRDTGLM